MPCVSPITRKCLTDRRFLINTSPEETVKKQAANQELRERKGVSAQANGAPYAAVQDET